MNETNFQKFEIAIEILFDPINNKKDKQEEANQFLNNFLNSPKILFEFCLNFLISNFYSKNKQQSLFWCLQKLIQIFKNEKEYEEIFEKEEGNKKILHENLLNLIKVRKKKKKKKFKFIFFKR